MQELIDKYAGSGKIELGNGTSNPEETVRLKEPAGKYWDLKQRKYVETPWLRLKYTKKDVHCYPVWVGDDND